MTHGSPRWLFASAVQAILLAAGSAQEEVECAGECVATWAKCGGRGFDAQLPCCKAGDACKYNDRSRPTYGQCRPTAGPRSEYPAHWKDPFTQACSSGGHGGGDCDPTSLQTTRAWEGVEIVKGSEEYSLGTFRDSGVLDTDLDCDERCAVTPECFVYTTNNSFRCELFTKGVINPSLETRFGLDDNIYTTKCFAPEPLCKVGTDAVRQVDPDLPYYERADGDVRSTLLVREPSTVEQCATLARMQNALGFAIEETEFNSLFGDRPFDWCTTLFPSTGGEEYEGRTQDYAPRAVPSTIYSIELC